MMNQLKDMNRFVVFLLAIGLAALFKVLDMSLSSTALSFKYSLLPFCLISIAVIGWYVGRWPAVLAAWIIGIGWYVIGLGTASGQVAEPVARPPQMGELAGILGHFYGLVYSVLFIILALPIATFLQVLRKAKESAWKDDVTDAYSALYFFKRAGTEIARANRYKRPFTVAYFVINGYEDFQRRLGDKMGKLLLAQTAETLQKHLRSADIVGRVADSEFAVLLPETGYEPAQIVVPRLQQQLQSTTQANSWSVTFAICAAACSQLPASLDEVLDSVQRDLAEAKKEAKSTMVIKELTKKDTAAANATPAANAEAGSGLPAAKS
jgi:diguanylate cyclase (GGDEF)-like protein